MELEEKSIQMIQNALFDIDNNLCARVNVYYRFSNKGIVQSLGEENIKKLMRDLKKIKSKVTDEISIEIDRLIEYIEVMFITDKLETN